MDQTLAIGGGRYVEAIGQREGRGRLLFLHGWACHAGYFRRMIEALPQDIAAVAFSLTGHGRSSPVPSLIPHVSHWVEEIDLVRRALAWKDAIIVGNSIGGGLALLYAQAHPERARALALSGSCPGGQAPSTAEVTRSVLHSLWRATRPPFKPKLVERLIHRQLKGVPVDVKEELLPGSLAATPEGLEGAARFGWEMNLDGLIRRLSLPALIIRGTKDAIMDPEREPLAAIPGSSTIGLPMGHFPMAESPPTFAAIMAGWVDQVEGGRPGALGDAM